MPEGRWIKLFEKIEDWEWFTDANAYRLFTYLLIKATWKPTTHAGVQLEPGEFVSTPERLGQILHLSRQQIRTAQNKLKKSGNITTRSTSKFTIYKVVNYADYQGSDQGNNQQKTQHSTSTQPANNQQITTEQEIKKERNNTLSHGAAGFAPPSVQTVADYCTKIGAPINPERFVAYYAKRAWRYHGQLMTDWQDVVKIWATRESDFNKSFKKKTTRELPEWYGHRDSNPASKETQEKLDALLADLEIDLKEEESWDI